MTEKQKHRLIVAGTVGTTVVLLYWLWKEFQAWNSPAQVLQSAPAPAAQTLANPNDIPPNTYNLSFQAPSLNNAPPLGVYVPTFGFIGIGPYSVQ